MLTVLYKIIDYNHIRLLGYPLMNDKSINNINQIT